MTQSETFLDYVAKALVEYPDEVEIERSVDELGVLLTLKVRQSDFGRVIGRSGATAKAIRTVLRTVGSKDNERVSLKIADPLSPSTERKPWGEV